MNIRLFNRNTITTILMMLTMIFIIVDAFIPQVTHLLFNNYIKLDLFLKAFILAIIIIHIAIDKNIKMDYLINITIFILLAYLSIDFIYQLRVNNLEYIINGYNAFFFFAFILYLSSFTTFYTNSKLFTSIIMLFGLTSAIIGIMQYLLNIPILGLGDTQSGFQVLSSTFYGSYGRQIRGFGLFNSGLGAGVYLVFLLPIAIFLGTKKKSYAIMSIVFLFAIFCTLTRNIYLGASIAIISSVMYIYVRNKKFLFFIPILFLLVAFIGLYAESFSGTSGGILDNTSRSMRQDQSIKELDNQNQSSILDYILGEGLYQSESTDASKRILIDNTYLHLIKHIGFSGFVIFLFVYLILLYTSIKAQKTAVNCGLYCFLAAWPAMALYNILISELLIYSTLVLLFSFDKRYPSISYKATTSKIQRGE